MLNPLGMFLFFFGNIPNYGYGHHTSLPAKRYSFATLLIRCPVACEICESWLATEEEQEEGGKAETEPTAKHNAQTSMEQLSSSSSAVLCLPHKQLLILCSGPAALIVFISEYKIYATAK